MKFIQINYLFLPLELSLRAWIHTEDSKRRTLQVCWTLISAIMISDYLYFDSTDLFWQRNDIATAITKFDQFDFLIDIVPREELKPPKRPFVSFFVFDAFLCIMFFIHWCRNIFYSSDSVFFIRFWPNIPNYWCELWFIIYSFEIF